VPVGVGWCHPVRVRLGRQLGRLHDLVLTKGETVMDDVQMAALATAIVLGPGAVITDGSTISASSVSTDAIHEQMLEFLRAIERVRQGRL
jgi:hypothetical protein